MTDYTATSHAGHYRAAAGLRDVMAGQTVTGRQLGIDALRGLVMILMALDHVRDFIHHDAAVFSPTDLGRTYPQLFVTRWVTHFCLPVFMFCAGIGISFWHRKKGSRVALARYLLTRGAWFIFLELTIMQLAYNLNVSSKYLILLLILWIFGICMLAMALLVFLPFRVLLIFSIATICLHNLLDRVNSATFGSAEWLWKMFHQPGLISIAGHPALVTYTIVPWVAVMTAGFCFGQLYTLNSAVRRKLKIMIGLAATSAFLVLRFANHYGDPAPWSAQKTTLLTILSFVNCTKYPGSLDFLLMTLGPAILFLAFCDRWTRSTVNRLAVFGRVPLFYFILHFFLIHGLLVLMSFLRYGGAALVFIFNPTPSMGGPGALFPANFGYNLWVVYAAWIGIVMALFPLCRWYGMMKSKRRAWWMDYL